MKKTFSKIDKPLFFITIASLIFGVMMVLSASSLKSFMKFGNSYYYFKRQLMFIIAGLILAFVILKIPIKFYKNKIILGVLAVLAGLIFVLVNEKIMNGIKGWLFVFGYGIQPSEFAKTILTLFLALSFERIMKLKNLNPTIKFIPFMVALVFITLIFMQPDFGTMMILAGMTAVVFLILPIDGKTKFVISSFTVISVLLILVIMLITGKGLSNSQVNRFKFKDPCTRYRQETGYQVCNGYIAINSGGFLGSGFGNSKQKYLYLPEAHTDFIYAIIIEETGLVTGAIIVISYFIIIWRIILIARHSFNLQGMIICYSTATYIGLHVLINLGGVLGLIPLTGVPLPFYSYGGSFMINLLSSLALVQRVAIENKIFEQKHLVR